MGKEYNAEELNNLSGDMLVSIVLSMQSQMAAMLDRLKMMQETNDRLTEQLSLARNFRFGRSSEKLDAIDGQINLFNEVEAMADIEAVEEPDEDAVLEKVRVKRPKGKREADLKGLPVEVISHEMNDDDLKKIFTSGSWKELPEETFRRVRYQPAQFTVEEHHVHVYAGDDNQTIVKADRPRSLIRSSIATPSLVTAVINAKYVNALPLYRIEQEFRRNDINISRQVMANWVIQCADRYLSLMYDRLHRELISRYPVLQADETPVEVTKDGRPAGSKSYMWVYRSGYHYKNPVILYDYEKTRKADNPDEFLKDFSGILLSDGFSAYNKLSHDKGDIIMANCWVHARRKFSDACKALKDKNQLKKTVAYQALEKIAVIYNLENELCSLDPEERLRCRISDIRPHVEEFFAWAKKVRDNGEVTLRGKTMEGIEYCLKRETQLKVFLSNGDVPLDNNATERAIRGFCIGRNNWRLIDTVRGANASAMIYSLVETAKVNGLRPHKYIEHLLQNILDHYDDTDLDFLEDLLPWSEALPDECRKKAN